MYGIVYNGFLICSIITLNYFSNIVAYLSNYMVRGHFEKMIDTIQIVFAIVTAIFVLLVCCFRQGKIVIMANKVRTLEESTFNLNRKLCNVKYSVKRSTKIIFLVNVTMWFLTVATTPALNDTDSIIYHMGVYSFSLIINNVLIQYSIILLLIQKYFSIVNTSFRPISKILVSSDEAHLVHCKSRSRNPIKINIFSELCELYSSLCDLSENLSDFYSPLMLFCISHIFVTLILFGYFIAKAVVIGKPILTILTYIHCAVILTHLLVMLISLTRCVQAVISEVSYNNINNVSNYVLLSNRLFIDNTDKKC